MTHDSGNTLLWEMYPACYHFDKSYVEYYTIVVAIQYTAIF